MLVKRFKTLFLDLDETLVHSCTLKENPEKIITAINDYGEEATVAIKWNYLLFLAGTKHTSLLLRIPRDTLVVLRDLYIHSLLAKLRECNN